MNRCCVPLLAALFMFAASCAVTRPVRYYTLAPSAGAAEPAKAGGPTILVAAMEAIEPLQDARIRYRTGAHQAGAYEFHRWTERPGAILRDSLVAALRASGQFRHVSESSGPAAADYQVRGKLDEFGEVDTPAITAKISLHLELIDMRASRTVWENNYEREEPSSGKTIDDVVQAMDRDLQQVVKQAAGEIGAFAAGTH